MQRRAFFTTQLAALLATQTARAQPKSQTILLQTSPVAGFQYHKGEALWPRLAAGQPLTLVREPQNPYDQRAVRIEWRGCKIGYIPRLDNAAISQLLDRGQPLTAAIEKMQQSDNPWRRLRVAIRLAASG